MLAAVPPNRVYEAFERELDTGRPSTVYTYFLALPGADIPVAVAAVSPRVAASCSEDGIAVLGRAYVRPEFRGQSAYVYTLQHRFEVCRERFGRRLLGVHIGTCSPRVETSFRHGFEGRTLFIGNEDLGSAGVVRALLGVTDAFDRQLAQDVPPSLADAHRIVLEFAERGADAVSAPTLMPALRKLADVRAVYRTLHQFLAALPRLR